VVKHPLGGIKIDEVERKADAVADLVASTLVASAGEPEARA